MHCFTTSARINLGPPLPPSAVGETLNFPTSSGGRRLTPSAHPPPFTSPGHSCADLQQLVPCWTTLPDRRATAGRAFTSTPKAQHGRDAQRGLKHFPIHSGFNSPRSRKKLSSSLPASARRAGLPEFYCASPQPSAVSGAQRTRSEPQRNRT